MRESEEEELAKCLPVPAEGVEVGGRTFRPAWINGSTSTWPYGFGRLELCDLLEVAVFRESLDGSWVGLIISPITNMPTIISP